MQVKILLIVVLCLGIITGYYLLRGENDNAPSGAPEIAHQHKENPNDTITRLQQRLAQAEQAPLIQSRLDEYDLKQLYIKDRASREGWLNTARYRKEQRQAQTEYQELRPEIGDDAYDRMLYALGRVNRVAVRDIMQNSTAEQYDLRTNDRIIEYDGQRVFTGQELNDLVTQGAFLPTLQLNDRDRTA